ncbi:FAD-binding domain-containing protein [Mycena latifolia]|nr:FAD-binding domain-containing protein [Mycena latifolia]
MPRCVGPLYTVFVLVSCALALDADIGHWATSSIQAAACSVEPGTAADVSVILQILGTTRTPFAVKGGGHTSNPGFSSTTGVQIAMSRFSSVTYHAATQTVDIGTGIVWDDVYAALAPFGVNIVGGRVSGVGIAGFTLGGAAFELVKPDGTIVTVTADSDPDLFFGLKGGLMIHTPDQIPAINAAIEKFTSTVTDPKAAVLPPGIVNLIFYDGPEPPAGIFDDFLATPALIADVGTKDFLTLVTSAPANISSGSRAAFHTVSLFSYSPTMVNAIVNETVFWGAELALAGATFISYDIEPFLPTLYTHATSPSAFPPVRTAGYLPLNLYFAWELPTSDDIFHEALRQSAAHLTQVAIADEQAIADAALYPNYALFDTPLEKIYGANLPRLQAIKKAVDPGNVMGLAGGFKF